MSAFAVAECKSLQLTGRENVLSTRREKRMTRWGTGFKNRRNKGLRSQERQRADAARTGDYPGAKSEGILGLQLPPPGQRPGLGAESAHKPIP